MRMCLLDSGAALVVCGAAEESGACGLADPRSLARSLETMRRRGALRAGTRVFLPLAVEKQQAAWTAVAELVWNVCGQDYPLQMLVPGSWTSQPPRTVKKKKLKKLTGGGQDGQLEAASVCGSHRNEWKEKVNTAPSTETCRTTQLEPPATPAGILWPLAPAGRQEPLYPPALCCSCHTIALASTVDPKP
ncbi:uncharacterized protein isoform X1 [Macaca fascicularis]|uniref:uncharacterized protein isoform X1 n=1 Tax=Macaca fascicularis TaxID=9541 RepID=UPI003D156619